MTSAFDMKPSCQIALVLFLGLGVVTGCGGRDRPPDADAVNDTQGDTTPDPLDGSAHDTTVPLDGTGDAVMQDSADPRPGPIFELGTNTTGANTPDSFTLLEDGDALNIELGFQGLWMVVLAFRTRDTFEGKLTIITRIDVDGVQQGELGLAKQKLIPGGNGLDYYYNLFLVVMEPAVAGQTANISVTVYDDYDHTLDETLQVQLIGGTSDQAQGSSGG